MTTLKDRVAVVTGASRGIGAAVARRLAATGARIVVHYRSSADAAAAVVASIEASGGRATAVAFDVADADAVNAGFAGIYAAHERIDILVNNAGLTDDGLLMRQSSEVLERVLRVNCLGAIHCARAVVRPMMKARRGRIIQISSVVAQMGNPGQTAYASSKGAIEAFTRSLALEVAGRGVTVNAVSPGFIDTDMSRAMPQAARARYIERIPIGRMGAAEEVAAAVEFLAGDDAGYITGQIIGVNGGLYV